MRIRLILLTVVLNSFLLVAQEKLNNLKAPTSPASSILGLQPTKVLSPKSYQALETAIYSNFVNEGNSIIPDDFALEFTPYWTTNHGLSILEYLYPKSGVDQLIRNASFSIASTQNFILGDSMKTNALGFGFRTTFYINNSSDRKDVEDKLIALSTNQALQGNLGSHFMQFAFSEDDFDKFWNEVKVKIEQEISKYPPIINGNGVDRFMEELYKEAKNLKSYDKTNDNNRLFLEEFQNIIDKKTYGKQYYEAFVDEIKNRYGFSVDIAYANLLNFPSNEFEFSIVPKQSVWVTPTYRVKKEGLKFLKILVVLRYEWFNTDYYTRYFNDIEVFQNNFDYGVSFAGEFSRFSIQIEMVGRSSRMEIPSGTDANGNELFRKKSDSDFQYIATFNYNVTDQINLSYSLGNQFEPIGNLSETLVSILNLNFGFGTPTKEDLNLAK